MTDAACVEFLQWALPRLGLRWSGYRKVRGQVCKRVARRLDRLGLPDLGAYRDYLEAHEEEWIQLDELCHITISRFFRDRRVFAFLEDDILPTLGRAALRRGDAVMRAWSSGCASGEEPYTLALLWKLTLAERFPGLDLAILATDVDEAMLARARVACYPESSLRELPSGWRAGAFVERDGLHCLQEHLRRRVTIAYHDLRTPAPGAPFDLVLCRNVAFTYFDEATQVSVCRRLADGLRPRGALVLGCHEALPAECEAFAPWSASYRVYTRIE